MAAGDTPVAQDLAATARLFDQAERRQQWLQAAIRVTSQLLSADGAEPLDLIVRAALRVADADLVTVVLPTGNRARLIVEVAAGEGAEKVVGSTHPMQGTLAGIAYGTGRPIRVGDASAETRPAHYFAPGFQVGAVMGLPLVGAARTRGALMIARRTGRPTFDESDVEAALTFAHQVASSLELADVRADRERMARLEDHDRIARDLHDHVIQRLFAVGLTLQGMCIAETEDAQRAERLNGLISDIDDTIRQIRTSIFDLRGQLGPRQGSARSDVLAVCSDLAGLLPSDPRVRFHGPIDTVVPQEVVDDLVAVLREALTNVARHARASHVSVLIEASAHELALEVTDDGTGITPGGRRSGLDNLRRRAEHLCGRLDVGPADAAAQRTGTRVAWTIPLR